MKLNRRQLARLGGGLGLSLAAPKAIFSEGKELPQFFINITCSGGASLADSFLALSSEQVRQAGGDPETLNCFPESQIQKVDGLPFSAVKLDTTIPNLGKLPVKTDQLPFVKKHGQNMTVITSEGSSVNHAVAQHRSVTGNNAWNGRTLMEANAAASQGSFIIPYLNLAAGGFAEPGLDPTTPDFAKAVDVADPLSFALSLHSREHIERLPSAELIEFARTIRGKIEDQSSLGQVLGRSETVQAWKAWRHKIRKGYEDSRLIDVFDLLKSDHPDRELLYTMFPRIGVDPFDSQAAIAYLALSKGISNTVSLGPSFQATIIQLGEIYNPPIAFDFSHQDHRAVQGFMWDRVLRVADKLITLLDQVEIGNTGRSIWSRTMIYFSSDFGRDRVRPRGAEKFGSGHHLNNGFLFISPMFRGGRILGGVDPKTALTYGVDLKTGDLTPQRTNTEEEVFSLVLHAMGVKATGLAQIGIS